MKLKELRGIMGAVVVFRPRPKTNGDLVKESYNSWIVVEEVKEKTFLFKNISTNHEITLGTDNTSSGLRIS
jgi:hypothetical protein